MMCFSGVLSGHGPDVTIPATLWLADFLMSLRDRKGFYSAGQTAKTRFVSLSSPKRGEGRGEELRLTFIGATTLCIQNAVKELTLVLTHG